MTARHHQVLREREGVVLGIEDRRLEQVQRIAGELMLHPGHDPGVEGGVVVVEARKMRRIRGERPGVQERERDEQA